MILLSLLASLALAADDFVDYTETVGETGVRFEMVAVPGARFWMGRHEVTWDEYDLFAFGTAAPDDLDAVTGPTQPFLDPTFGYGHDGFPAITLTQYAAGEYARWLSQKTGRMYRLPTPDEWEHAARAGAATRWSFGDDPAELDRYAWYSGNSGGTPHRVGTRLANPWGLFDLYGNVAEWLLGQTVAAGGAWNEPLERVGPSARLLPVSAWSRRDPSFPRSRWWYTDAPFVGFRLVRPLE
ncbi:MAG TPA: formylglycine-generating enzyme family protein [Bdellovibrionota bacterium]|nr:formylglycine-generating enzyme family protein [Bdellovibrionota bacterium]